MTYILILILSFPLLAGFEQELSELKKQQIEIQTLMNEAKSCIPRYFQGKYELCTGVTFDQKVWEKIKGLTFKSCQDEIRAQGYQVITDSLQEVKNKYPKFVASTLRAEVQYQEKLVIFKENSANRIDCIHELIHIYQHDSKLTNKLAPLKRLERENVFVTHLNRAISFVEEAEKKKETKKAKAMSDKLTPFISFIYEWKDLDVWFDEKDDHFFIYENCKELNCTPLDKDIALANLYGFKEHFSDIEKKAIENAAESNVKEKQKSISQNVIKDWKRLAIPDSTIKNLLGLDWDRLLQEMRSQRLEIYQVSSKYKIKGLEEFTISDEKLQKIAPLPSDLLSQNSKILSGDAFAKFIPLKNKNVIVLTSLSTKSSFVHEYLHFLQIKSNPEYAIALNRSTELQSEFQSGKISREKYEEEAMKSNAMIWFAEREVYEKLLQFKDSVSKLEHLNNMELFQVYSKKLSGI